MSDVGNTRTVIFRFDNAELDTSVFELRVDGARVPIEPQVFEVLSYLVTHRERLVPRTEILDAVWGDRFVSDSALSSRVAAARTAIGDNGKSQRLIRTVHGRGLQFVGDVMIETKAGRGDDPPSQPADLRQSIKFARADDGAEIAVATVGQGPPLVKAANWLTHVERDWTSPIWNHWNTELAARYTYVRYDSRGCGLSDQDIRGSSLSDVDRWVADLEAVVDQQGLEQFVLFGMSQGGVPAVTYAARHPERVSHLVLLGCYSRGMRRRGDEAAAEAGVILDMIRVGWGGRNPSFRSFFTTNMLPNATSEHVRWFNELQRETASTENALLLEQAFYDVDLAEIAPEVRVPTMVLHAEADMCAPYDEGRRLAGLIPNAELVTLDTPNHVLMADEPAWATFLERLTEFTST